jgi:hypothetical protein
MAMRGQYAAIMILCFIFGGYFLLHYFSNLFMLLPARPPNPPMDEFNNSSGLFNASNRTFAGEAAFRNNIFEPFSPNSLMILLGGIVSVSGGVAIWQLGREKELKTVREDLTSLLLTPEEKKVTDELRKAGGSMAQNELVRKTQLSKVKVHRVLTRLESKNIIKKYSYGITNKIVLEQKLK